MRAGQITELLRSAEAELSPPVCQHHACVVEVRFSAVRIEDDVAVHTSNTEVLTRIPRDLIEI